MNQFNPTLVIRRDDLAYILTALMTARPDLREAFELVAQATGITEYLPPAPPVITVELPQRQLVEGVRK